MRYVPMMSHPPPERDLTDGYKKRRIVAKT
jgi:hypothetical protein